DTRSGIWKKVEEVRTRHLRKTCEIQVLLRHAGVAQAMPRIPRRKMFKSDVLAPHLQNVDMKLWHACA
ncbi:hypothetical protein HAX54_006491, partial [Datura stramonium]|nr:hypothetical protein [Datura stramonium]